MDTEIMIRNLQNVAKEHEHDKLFTGQTNISLMCRDVIRRLGLLKEYEATGLTPEKIREMDRLYAEMCKELAEERKKHRWIPVEERNPTNEKWKAYICTLDGELCGLDKPFTGMSGFENGMWDDMECVIAWQPLPEPYKAGERQNDSKEKEEG